MGKANSNISLYRDPYAAWCHDNDKTLINGSKIYTGSITADKINVSDLFSKNITATGTIKGVNLEGARGSFEGRITATSGDIGFLEIRENQLWGNFFDNDTVADYSFSKTIFSASVFPENATSHDEKVATIYADSLYDGGRVVLTGKGRISIRTKGTVDFRNDNTNESDIVFDFSANAGSIMNVKGKAKFDGEQNFYNFSYCPTITDTASGVGCAFKASRGLFNEALIDKLIMTSSTSKIPFYKYTGTSGGSMTGLTQVAAITNDGTFSGAGVSITGTVSANNASIKNSVSAASISASGAISAASLSTTGSIDVYGQTRMRGGVEIYHASPYIDFHRDNSTSDYTTRLLETSAGILLYYGSCFRPSAEHSGSATLGASGNRWATAWLTNGVNSSSDRNQKENILEIGEKYEALFERLVPVSYELIGSNHDRVHIGYISQDVETAMEEVGLTDKEFAGFCKDLKTETIEETGEVVQIYDENGNPEYVYSLRYSEFIALNTHMIQRLAKRVEALEEENIKLKNSLAS